MTAREAILARIRAAVADPRPSEPVPRAYRIAGGLSRAEIVERFVERARDYRADVVLTPDPGAAVAAALAAADVARAGVPVDLESSLRPNGLEVVEDDCLTPYELDGLDAAVTLCAAACAETGTIALDGGAGQGRRALTLVPDLHVCVVRAAQIVETVPELIAALEPSAQDGRPIVLVSGPSATSDIELIRVEGVHGPRRLVIVIAT